MLLKTVSTTIFHQYRLYVKNLTSFEIVRIHSSLPCRNSTSHHSVCFKEIPRDGERRTNFFYRQILANVSKFVYHDRMACRVHVAEGRGKGRLISNEECTDAFLSRRPRYAREDRRFVWAARACVMAFGNSKRKLIVGGPPDRAGLCVQGTPRRC